MTPLSRAERTTLEMLVGAQRGVELWIEWLMDEHLRTLMSPAAQAALEKRRADQCLERRLSQPQLVKNYVVTLD